MTYFTTSLSKYKYKSWYTNLLFVGDAVYVQSGKNEIPADATAVSQEEFNEMEASLRTN